MNAGALSHQSLHASYTRRSSTCQAYTDQGERSCAQRCVVYIAHCKSVHVHGGQRDGQRHDADRNNHDVHRQTDRQTAKVTASARYGAMSHAGSNEAIGKIKWVCGRRAVVSDAWECWQCDYMQTRCMNETRMSSCEWQDTETWFCALCVLHVRAKGSGERRFTYLSRPRLPSPPLAISQLDNDDELSQVST